MTAGGAVSRADLLAAHARSQREFYAGLAGGSTDSALVRWPGVQATIVPERPWFSILNGVLFDEVAALAGPLAQIEVAYRQRGVHAWRVWAAPEQQRAESLLSEAGFALSEAAPQRMAAAIAQVDLSPRTRIELVTDPTWQLVARCNDRAHGISADYTLGAAFTRMNDPASHLYAAHVDGQVVSALLAREHEGDCYFWFVATVPEARGRGLASELMRIALRHAVARGCRTTTLEASPMGESAYAALGFAGLGRLAVFEYFEQ